MTSNKTMFASRHDKEPKQVIIDAVGDLSGIAISGYQVLVGVYIRPDKTAGGWQRTHEEKKEDKYQGTVGVILKMGPLAFSEYDEARFSWEEGEVPKIGDFVWFNLHDGRSRAIRGHTCRVMESKQVRGTTQDPDIII